MSDLPLTCLTFLGVAWSACRAFSMQWIMSPVKRFLSRPSGPWHIVVKTIRTVPKGTSVTMFSFRSTQDLSYVGTRYVTDWLLETMSGWIFFIYLKWEYLALTRSDDKTLLLEASANYSPSASRPWPFRHCHVVVITNEDLFKPRRFFNGTLFFTPHPCIISEAYCLANLLPSLLTLAMENKSR